MIENVRGILGEEFGSYRKEFEACIEELDYTVMGWRLLNASDFGVPQLRPRTVFVALQEDYAEEFSWPEHKRSKPRTVGKALHDLISSRGWQGADQWSGRANKIAPTIVGGSKKHGGPDLGPTRAKRAWAKLGVNGHLIWNEPPGPDFEGNPCLTVRMVARLQGFPDDWQFSGRKTASYRQVGNAFPPPVAQSIGRQILSALATPRLVTATV